MKFLFVDHSDIGSLHDYWSWFAFESEWAPMVTDGHIPSVIIFEVVETTEEIMEAQKEWIFRSFR